MPRDATAPAIEFRNVRRTHLRGRREVAALDGLTLSIGEGEFVAVVGASGSGKSTMLHLAGALDRPTSGEVVIDGRVTTGLDNDELALLRRAKIGFVFQAFHLMPAMTVLENVMLPAQLAGRPPAASEARAADLLERVGLARRLDHRPEELSGGEMQRTAVARALINDPPILLADEPTGNLDSAAGRDVLALLAGLGRGRTVVMVTHDPAAAAAAGRIIRLRDGRLERIQQ